MRSAVRLNGSLLRQLCESRFADGPNGLLDAWALEKGLHRATLQRWMAGSMPGSADALLHLASRLDVDPFGLLEIGRAADAVQELIAAFQNDYWRPPLKFIRDFIGRRAEWPPSSLARRHYGRDWISRDFDHAARDHRHYYAVVELRPGTDPRASGPQVFHFAFRHATHFGARWLQYGAIVRSRDCVSLLHIGGQTDEKVMESEQDPTRVETWFGESPAQFRVASLHAFDLSLRPYGDREMPAVRFLS